MVVGVLVELSSKKIDKIFDYNVPPDLIDLVRIGIRVEVPFGRQTLDGFILEIKEGSESELKDIISIKDSEAVLNAELLQLGKYMSSEYFSTLISCYQIMLPKALKAKNKGKNLLKLDTYYRLNESNIDFSSLTAKQKEIVDICIKETCVLRQELLAISISALKTLIKKGYLSEEKKEHYRLVYSNQSFVRRELTKEQKEVVTDIENSSDSVYLLYGVTGSGKTEVYMELIERQLKLGKTSIVLVPEISLTPQMISRFVQRFGNQIAALHSALSDGEKYDEWRRIVRGEAKIVIGARSAVFAPLENIGVIIIDEEHSDSYKQSELNPKYHAVDMAIARSKYHNCKVILGSATPRLETFAKALKGIYHLEKLLSRANGKALPIVNIVDMNTAMKTSVGHFSQKLIEAIGERVRRKEQVILLLNRRGYSSFVMCKNCGCTIKCPNCDITLTYHKSSNNLRCHYCGYAQKIVIKCPSCGENAINDLGCGTEKIEEELSALFEARILRMDYDTTSKKGSHQRMVEAFKNHEYDILLGTQVVAKGLDFSLVTLVGVINADTGLNIPDFRSSENTFALLDQVAGRAGRGSNNGEVIIQTFNPDHYAINFAQKHDYVNFYKYEMNIRKTLKYPPYYYLTYIKTSGKDCDYLKKESDKIRRCLDRNLSDVIILGPTQSTIFKVNNIYRYGIIVKYKKKNDLNVIINMILNHYKSNASIRIDIDNNPSQMI